MATLKHTQEEPCDPGKAVFGIISNAKRHDYELEIFYSPHDNEDGWSTIKTNLSHLSSENFDIRFSYNINRCSYKAYDKNIKNIISKANEAKNAREYLKQLENKTIYQRKDLFARHEQKYKITLGLFLYLASKRAKSLGNYMKFIFRIHYSNDLLLSMRCPDLSLYCTIDPYSHSIWINKNIMEKIVLPERSKNAHKMD